MDNEPMTWPEILRTHLAECGECKGDMLNLCVIGDIIRKFAGAAQDEQLMGAYLEVR